MEQMNTNLRNLKKMQFREKILNSAAQEFKSRGFLNTSISNIMQTANLGVGTFYNYFESKDEVLTELTKNLFAQVADKIHKEIQKKYSALELLEFACGNIAHLIDENKFVLPLLDTAMKNSDKPKKISSPGLRKFFEEIILLGQERGEIRQDIPADVIAEMFHSIYQAAAFSKLEIDFRENVRLKVKILLDGIKNFRSGFND